MNPISYYAPIIAHFLIGSFFVFFGFVNIEQWDHNIAVMKQKKIPFPKLVLCIGIAWQIIAGLMVVAGVYLIFAALSLILFTLISILMFHSFWRYHGQEREISRLVFLIHITVTVGALLLLMKS